MWAPTEQRPDTGRDRASSRGFRPWVGLAATLATFALVSEVVGAEGMATKAGSASSSEALAVSPAPGDSPAARMARAIAEGLAAHAERNPDHPRLVVGAPVRGEQDGKGFRITFPEARLVLHRRTSLVLGDRVLSVAPAGDAYAFRVPLPGHIRIDESEREGTATLALGGGEFSGHWHVERGEFTRLAGRIDDLALTLAPSAPMVVSLNGGELAFEFSKSAEAPGTWSGSGALGLEAFRAPSPTGGRVIVDGLSVQATLEETSVPAWSRVLAGAGAAAADGGGAIRADRSANARGPDWGRATIEIGAEGFSFQMPGRARRNRTGDAPKSAGADPERPHLKLKHLLAQAELDARASPSTIRLALKASDMAYGPMEIPHNLRPHEIALDVTASPLPLHSILTALWRSAPDGLLAALPTAVGARLVTLIYAADPRLHVQELRIATRTGRLGGNAEFRLAKPGAKLPVQGSARLKIGGMGSVLTALMSAKKRDPRLLLGVPFVLILQGLGRAEPGTSGEEPVYAYDVEVVPAGVLRINQAPLIIDDLMRMNRMTGIGGP